MTYTLPEPAYIWHDNPEDEYDNEMFDFKQVGAVDESDIYLSGKCEHCTRLYTEQQLRDACMQGQRDMREAAAEAIDDGCRENIMTASDCIEAINALPIGEI